MKKLFDTFNYKKLTFKNRFFRSGTWICQANEDGTLKPEFMDYYSNLAKQNLGCVIFGYARVDSTEKANSGMTGLWDDKFILELKKLTDEYHKNNTIVGIQLAMGGAQIHYSGDIEWKILSPSKVMLPARTDKFGNEVVYTANEISKDEINTTIENFTNAAVRVKEAGFDMVQLHCGHGYFLSSWMNPDQNKRTDEYGGSVEKRSKYIIELYKSVRNAVGDDFSIGVKINSEERIGDYSNHESMLYLCKELDKLKVDLIEISGFFPSRTKKTNPSGPYFKDFASKLTKEVNALVVLTGGNKYYDESLKVLNETQIDFIGLSRPLIAEIDLVKKWEENPEHKSICISCNHCHKVINKCVFDK